MVDPQSSLASSACYFFPIPTIMPGSYQGQNKKKQSSGQLTITLDWIYERSVISLLLLKSTDNDISMLDTRTGIPHRLSKL